MGLRHDFGANKNEIRYDSQGKACTGAGGIMDYSRNKDNEFILWSTCSSEDFTSLMTKKPDCLAPMTPTNVPQTSNPSLTPLECKLPEFLSTLKGTQKLTLNGKFIAISHTY